MRPTWRDGGLYYPRNDERADAEGHRTEMEPITGNVLLAYARLNVPDGLWKLYNHPWGRGHHSEPALSEVAVDVDVTRAYFDRERRELAFSLHRRNDRDGDGVVALANFDKAGERWTLRKDGLAVASGGRDAELMTATGEVRRGDGGVELRCPPGAPHRYTVSFGGAAPFEGRVEGERS